MLIPVPVISVLPCIPLGLSSKDWSLCCHGLLWKYCGGAMDFAV